MSGQPYINPLDPAKFRQQYLANLALRANIDDANLQANKVYKRTGAPTQPTDTRTTAEKQADLYRLRIEVRSKIGEIADGANADKIVQQLDDDQLRFLSDQLPFIVADLKPKYRTGILAEIFIPYFEKYMNQYQKTKGVNSGLQQETGDQILLNQQIIMANMASKSDINDIDDAIRELGVQNSNMGKAISRNLANIQDVLDYLPETMVELDRADNAILKSQIQSTLNDIVKDLPTKGELNELVRQLAIAQGRMNVAGVEQILGRIEEITDAGGDIRGEIQVLQQLLAQAKAERGEASANRPAVAQAQDTRSLSTFIFTTPSGNRFRYIDPDEIGSAIKKNDLDLYLTQLENVISAARLYGGTPKRDVKTKGQIKAFLEARDEVIRQELEQVMAQSNIQEAEVIGTFGSPEPKSKSRRPVVELEEIEEEGVGGRGIKSKVIKVGRGLARPAHNPFQRTDVLTPHIDIDMSAGVKPTPRFVPFGRFVINKDRLEKDIIAIKRPAGSVVQELPSKRVSRALGGVVRKMVGGQIPSFDDINKLDKDEQEYLHHLASKSHLLDKINIPTPKKDDDERDINQFEIMRGQILAGNDSEDLVKKFKQLILRMADRDLIPRRQVKELLVMLTQNGY